MDLKKVSGVAQRDVVKKTKYNKLNPKVNVLEIKITDVSTLIHIKQYNTDKKNLEREKEEVENTVPDVRGLASTIDLNINIGKVEDKEPSHDKNVTASEFD